jgi:hypothetical protein
MEALEPVQQGHIDKRLSIVPYNALPTGKPVVSVGILTHTSGNTVWPEGGNHIPTIHKIWIGAQQGISWRRSGNFLYYRFGYLGLSVALTSHKAAKKQNQTGCGSLGI